MSSFPKQAATREVGAEDPREYLRGGASRQLVVRVGHRRPRQRARLLRVDRASALLRARAVVVASRRRKLPLPPPHLGTLLPGPVQRREVFHHSLRAELRLVVTYVGSNYWVSA